LGEETKISIRNVRRHAKEDIKKTQESEKLQEDMRYESEDTLQTMTDNHTEKVNKLLDHKEKEIMEV
jgi:ribosome recycling factor